MKTKLFIAALIAAVTFPVLAQTKPAAPTMTPEQRAAKKAESQARFAALSPEEKAARKGHKQKPVPPAAPKAAK